MKKISFNLLILLSVLFFHLHAQTERPLGLILDDVDYNNTKHLPDYSGSKYNKIKLRVDLRPYCPIPGDQGNIGSCVGWAVGYGALTISKAVKADIKNQEMITQMAHSASFLYNQIKDPMGDCKAGARITDALKFLTNEGDCLSTTFPNSQTSCNTPVNALSRKEASYFKIKDFAALYRLSDDPRKKLDKTLKALSSDHPVIVGIKATTSFWSIRPGQDLWDPQPNEAYIGGHAMIVVGYDYVSKRIFLMNSYGSNWGNNGFIQMNFDDFSRLVKYGFQISIDEEFPFAPPAPQQNVVATTQLKGSFDFRYPTGYGKDAEGNDIIQFSNVNTNWNPDRGLYELSPKTWKINSVFQLLARNIPEGKYVYVFSLDPAGKVELHWPLNAGNDAMTTKVASWVPSPDAEVVIPGEDNVLQLDQVGEDFLYVLYSEKEVTDLAQRLHKIKTSPGSFMEKLERGFGDLMIAPQYIQYDPSQMHFQCQVPENKGTLVPVVLSVRGV